MWNSLSIEAKSKPTLSSFKYHLKKKDKPNKLFYYGDRLPSLIHAKIRMGCSNLNSHLALILHVKDNPCCSCGFHIESPKHYFLNCRLYAGPRAKMLESINAITDCNINILLFGDNNLNYALNCTIFQSVHKFIKNSRRFY